MKRSQWLENIQRQLPTFIEEAGIPAQIFMAAVTLLLGFLFAVAGRSLATRLTRRLGRRLAAWGRLGEPAGSERLEHVIGSTVYWGVLLLALMTATEILGLPVVTHWLGQVVTYVPRLVAAVLIVAVALIGAKLIGRLVLRAASSANVRAAERLRRAAEVTVVLASLVVAVEQLGIEISFLKSFILIFAGAVLGGAALAFALGSRELVRNVLSVHYLQRHYQVGQTIRTHELEGRILRITETAVIVEGHDGQVLIPASELLHSRSTLVLKSSAK